MNKRKLRIIIFSLLIINLIFTSITMAKTDVKSLLTNLPSQQDYPEAGGIILKDKNIADFTNSNQYRYKREAIIKVFNKRGIKKFGEVKIKFNKEREEIKILDAKTIKPDGTVVKAKENAINEITPPELSKANIYSDVREKVISMPALEPGAIIVYSYVKRVKDPIIKDEFWFENYFQTTEPVKESSLIVKTPAEKKINYRERLMDIKPTITEANGIKTYFWKKESVPAIVREPAMLPLQDIMPAVILSTLDSWDQFSSWYNGLIDDQYKLNDALREKAKELTENANERQAKIRALYNYVALNIRYIGLEFGIGGYKPHTAIEIYNNKYGDCKDKATLLLTMLKEIGVEAEPVLINAKWHPKLKIVTPNNFNHMILYLPEEGLYLDPTSDVIMYNDLPVQDQGKQVLLPFSKKLAKTPVMPASKNKETIKQKVKLNKSGNATIKIIWQDKGYYNAVYKNLFRKYTPRQRGLIIRQIVNKSFPNADIIDYNLHGVEGLDEEFKMNITIGVNNYVRRMANLMTLRPMQFPINLSKVVGPKQREYSLYFGTTLKIVRKIEIELPEGVSINHLPKDVRQDNKVGKLDLNYSRRGKKVIVDFALQIKQPQVEVGNYQLTRKLFNQVGQVTQNQILLNVNN